MFIPATMYPAQSMRNFVCDRLTAAAREIVGAFEKRIEDYEAEIARQRRMLDTVFTPEKKFHRPGTPTSKSELNSPVSVRECRPFHIL